MFAKLKKLSICCWEILGFVLTYTRPVDPVAVAIVTATCSDRETYYMNNGDSFMLLNLKYHSYLWVPSGQFFQS
jgi:hypothetical protein